MKKIIEEKFSALFGRGCETFAAPGRINLIGEHTDYNGGYVFPGAIDKCIMAGIRVDSGKKVRLFSIDYDQYAEFELPEFIGRSGWLNGGSGYAGAGEEQQAVDSFRLVQDSLLLQLWRVSLHLHSMNFLGTGLRSLNLPE